MNFSTLWGEEHAEENFIPHAFNVIISHRPNTSTLVCASYSVRINNTLFQAIF